MFLSFDYMCLSVIFLHYVPVLFFSANWKSWYYNSHDSVNLNHTHLIAGCFFQSVSTITDRRLASWATLFTQKTHLHVLLIFMQDVDSDTNFVLASWKLRCLSYSLYASTCNISISIFKHFVFPQFRSYWKLRKWR